MKNFVDETRALWRRSQFAWGPLDCIMATCDHVQRVTGVDAAAPWRGTYDSREGAEAICAPYGGVLGVFRHGMSAAGFVEAEPALGRPVIARVGDHEVAGVQMGAMVGFLHPERGMTELRIPVLAAWAI